MASPTKSAVSPPLPGCQWLLFHHPPWGSFNTVTDSLAIFFFTFHSNHIQSHTSRNHDLTRFCRSQIHILKRGLFFFNEEINLSFLHCNPSQ